MPAALPAAGTNNLQRTTHTSQAPCIASERRERARRSGAKGPRERRRKGVRGDEVPRIKEVRAPGRIRTCDLWLRRPTLYPAELRAHTRPAEGRSELRAVARPEGLEPPTYGFEARRSIQLSYGRASPQGYQKRLRESFPMGLGRKRLPESSCQADAASAAGFAYPLPRKNRAPSPTFMEVAKIALKGTPPSVRRPKASRPAEAMQPHCVQSGSPPN